MISTHEIKKSYGNLQVLKGVSIDIKEGEVVSVVGASGAGKTTLLQIIGTLSTFDSGNVYINGEDTGKLQGNSLSKFRNQNIGFVFQFHQLLPEFSALENVCIPGFISKAPRRKVEKRAAELLDFLKLSERMEHKPGELSGGEQQRVAIARALINKPRVIFADEPTGNLDGKTESRILKILKDAKKTEGITVIVASHSKKFINQADRVIQISSGELEDSLK